VKIRILVAFGVALVAMAALPAMASARTIYSGMCGSDVVALQKRLAARSFLPPRYHTGCFDYRTSQAVVAFQGWVNFTRTGVATPLTQLRLKMSVRPRPGATQNYRHIEVIKSKQVALLITRKGIVRRTVHVSTARPGYSTPRGRYHIYAKARMSWSKPFQVWLPWASYVVGGIAFHSYPDVPTYPASHGCIRLGWNNRVRPRCSARGGHALPLRQPGHQGLDQALAAALARAEQRGLTLLFRCAQRDSSSRSAPECGLGSLPGSGGSSDSSERADRQSAASISGPGPPGSCALSMVGKRTAASAITSAAASPIAASASTVRGAGASTAER